LRNGAWTRIGKASAYLATGISKKPGPVRQFFFEFSGLQLVFNRATWVQRKKTRQRRGDCEQNPGLLVSSAAFGEQAFVLKVLGSPWAGARNQQKFEFGAKEAKMA